MTRHRIALPTVLPAAFGLALLAAPVLAQSSAPAPVLNVGSSEHAIARKIDLSIGRSLIVELPRDAKEVFVANPKVANAVVRSARKLFIIGIADGSTSMFVIDGEGRQITALEIEVGRDLNVLRQTLRTALPKAQIEIKPAGNSIPSSAMSPTLRRRPRPSTSQTPSSGRRAGCSPPPREPSSTR